MKIFVDSANFVELDEALKRGFAKGITTNPSIMAKERKGSFEEHIRKIIDLIKKHDYDIPLSIEVFSKDADEMIKQAEEFIRHFGDYPNLYIKVPIGWDELKVIHQLHRNGVKINCTCCMTVNQAIMAAQAGADFVSLFWCRIRDIGHDAFQIVRQTREIFDHSDTTSEIIVGSIRHIVDVNEAFEAGAHIVTIPPRFFKDYCRHPQTDGAVNQFVTEFEAWLK
ncbi:MAG: fructose-6-phosphate aldolase [Planctomycetes bacterium]|nr:fructose-6-phosphate aldolase [Planctomycetota bacterium]